MMTSMTKLSHSASSGKAQRGVTLVVTLIILVAMMLTVSASLRSNTIQERIAGNTRAYQNAFQAAESALRNCEDRILNPPAAGLPTQIISTSATGTAGERWKTTTWWDTNKISVTLHSSDNTTTAACLIEEVSFGGSTGYYVTARGVTGAGETFVQSVLAPE